MWTGIDWLRQCFCGNSARASTSVSLSARRVRQCADGSTIEFDFGTFDSWCVYVTRPGRERQAPRDAQYFADLKQLHGQHPRILDDFIEVFTRTTKEIDAALLARISEIASQYPPDVRPDVEVLLTTLYAAMIAEENRVNAPLGRRIKRLGVHQVLVEGMRVEDAARFSRGKPWRVLEELCVARGF